MAYSQEVQDMLNRIRREVESAVYTPPAWALDRVKDDLVGAILKSAFNRTLAETIGKMIADAFSQTIVLSVAQEFHRIAADEVAQGTRHLAYEMEALRRAIRRDQDQDDWWKQGPAEADEHEGGQDLPVQ
jgi:hypothetical protein